MLVYSFPLYKIWTIGFICCYSLWEFISEDLRLGKDHTHIFLSKYHPCLWKFRHYIYLAPQTFPKNLPFPSPPPHPLLLFTKETSLGPILVNPEPHAILQPTTWGQQNLTISAMGAFIFPSTKGNLIGLRLCSALLRSGGKVSRTQEHWKPVKTNHRVCLPHPKPCRSDPCHSDCRYLLGNRYSRD